MKTISRKEFLKNLGLAGVGVVAAPMMIRCASGDDDVLTDTGSGSSETGCTVTNSETEGPYPTNSPSSLVRTNIVGDRTGIALAITLTIQNVNEDCANLENAIVDVWHCDKDGNYSEYNEFANNSTHFLRGRQTTNANGQVGFTSIFPGWYMGRATHLHIHVYDASGNSLLVTQIAFPEGEDSAINNVFTNGSSYGYTQGMSGYTYNDEDGIFSDGYENEMSNVTGSNAAGYALTHTIKVDA